MKRSMTNLWGGARQAIFVLSLAMLASATVGADIRDSKSAAVESYLTRWQAESGAPGVSAAIAVGGRIEFSGGVGVADLQSGTSQNGRSVHGIGSISKTQALVAVMQLVERRKVKLDDEIQVYASWFPRKSRPITVRHILTHTSGIRHYRKGEFGEGGVMAFRHYDAFEESTRRWRDEALLFEPGTHWSYSTYATSLMQAIVETASGQPFGEYLAENIWRPTGMADTRLDISERIVPRRGQGYMRAKSGELLNVPNEDVSYKYAGGGMISTDEDLCRFGIALNAGRLLRPETLTEVYRLQLPADIANTQTDLDAFAAANPGKTPRSRGLRQGLIFNLESDSQGRRYAGHSGGVKGTTSRFINFTQHGVVVALHLNIDDTGPVDLLKAAESLAAIYLADLPVASRAGR